MDASPPLDFRPRWATELDSTRAEVAWLWHGYLAPGNVTLLTSQAKSGKSTLAAVLLARRAAGAPLAGLPLAPGRTAVVSEEHEAHWSQRCRTLDFGNSAAFFCCPFGAAKPTQQQWRALLDALAKLHGSDGVDLAIIDPLARFLPPGCESNGDLMMQALLPLEVLQAVNMAVLLVHHPSKQPGAEGQRARGHGTLIGHVDINLEMGFYRGASEDDRRRILRAFSRHAATPRRLVLEWLADGTDYLSRGEPHDEQFRENWQQHLLPLFETAPAKLTRDELFACLPRGRGTPSPATIVRWLDRAVERQLLLCDGTGHRNSPYRYWLPAREEEWMKDPIYRLKKKDEENRAQLERLYASSREMEPVARRGGKRGKGEGE